MVLASSISLTFTQSSERALLSSVVSQSWLGIHFAEAFVALQRNALAAGRGHRLEQADRTVDRRVLVLTPQRRRRRRPRINLLQRGREFVELAGIGRAEQRLVDHRDFLDAAQRALEFKADAFRELALPAALSLIRQSIKSSGDIFRRGRSLRGVAGDARLQHAGNRGLLDHLAVIAAMQAVQKIADRTRFLDELAQIVAGADFAG